MTASAGVGCLSPVTIINAQIDPLCEDGTLLEAALKRRASRQTRKTYAGSTREFFGMAVAVKDAAAAQKYGGQEFRSSFAK